VGLFKAEMVRSIWESVIRDTRCSDGSSAWMRLNAAGSWRPYNERQTCAEKTPRISGFKDVWRPVYDEEVKRLMLSRC